MRELVGSLRFLGFSDAWVPEGLGAGEVRFVGPHVRGMGLFQVLDMAEDSFLAGLVSVMDPPDTWVPSHLDLRPGE